MSRAFVLTLALLFAAPAPVLAGDPPPAGPKAGDAGKPADATKADATAKWLDELRAKMAGKMEQEEADAKASIAHLVEIWKDSEVPADMKKAVPELLEKYGRGKGGVAVAAIDALAELGAETGAKPIREILTKSIDAKEPPAEIYTACLRNLKKLADRSKATTGYLVDLLKRKENDIVAKAADAIAGYKNSTGPIRRDLLEEVIKIGESAYQASRDGKNTAAVTKWNTISGGVMGALNGLAGQNFSDPLAARKWFNDHKKDAKIWGGA